MNDSNKLIDPQGRWIRKMRVSLTDVCNFRCTYCMPGNVRFQSAETLLPAKTLVDMCAGLVSCGISELRITGGEPMARREFKEIVSGLSDLPVEKLGLTTNGFWLEEWLPFLSETNCRHINVSLDSLNAEGFLAITGNRGFERVYRSILKAKAMGFPVKINVVVIRGANDHEVADFVRFSAEHGIPVRFLEFMKIGPLRTQHEDVFVSAGEIITRLAETTALEPIQAEADATAFSYRTADGAEVGFIASESRPFCGSCSRLRLSARGVLRACLMSEDGVDLKNFTLAEYPDALASVLPMKPTGRIPEIAQPMNEIGG